MQSRRQYRAICTKEGEIVMDIIKKFFILLSKILGIIVMLVGILLGLLGVFGVVDCVMNQDYFIFDYYIQLVIKAVLVFYIGWRLLCIRKTIYYINKIVYYIKNREQIAYQKEQKRHEVALEEAERYALERQTSIVEEWNKEENNREILEVWSRQQKKRDKKNREQKNAEVLEAWKAMKEGYIDKPDKERKQNINIHMCSGTDTVWTITFILSLFIVIGSLISIPVFCSILDQEYLGILTCVLTVLFWGGMFFCWTSKGHVDGEKNIVIISTDQSILYKMDLNKMFDSHSDIPISQIGRMIYFHKKGKENEETQEKINLLLQSKESLEMLIESIINPDTEERNYLDWTVKRLNSPMLINKTFRTYIKYWDEIEDKWILSPLPKATEGYDRICQLVKRRNINI